MKTMLKSCVLVAVTSLTVSLAIAADSPPTVTKCILTASKVRGSDMILAQGLLSATADDFENTSEVVVTVDAKDMAAPLTSVFPVNDRTFKKGTFSSILIEGSSKQLFKVKTKTGKFTFKAKNINLSGLACPFDLIIDIGEHQTLLEVTEETANGKKPVPMQFMQGVKNLLRLDIVKIKKGIRYDTDSVLVKGAFATATAFDTNKPVVTTIGTDTFTVPGSEFTTKNEIMLCKTTTIEGPFAVEKFDPVKCTLLIKITKALLSHTGKVEFRIDLFGITLPATTVTLPADPQRPPPPRRYTFWELTHYNQPGATWIYVQKRGTARFETVINVFPGSPCFVVREMDDGIAGADFVYCNESDGVHFIRLAFVGGYLGLDLEYDFDLLWWPSDGLAPGERFTDSSSMTGRAAILGQTLSISGTATSAITRVGPVQMVTVQAGTFQTVRYDTSLTLDGTMSYHGQVLGSITLVIKEKNYASLDAGIVKRARTGIVTGKVPGEGTTRETISANYELEEYELPPR